MRFSRFGPRGTANSTRPLYATVPTANAAATGAPITIAAALTTPKIRMLQCDMIARATGGVKKRLRKLCLAMRYL